MDAMRKRLLAVALLGGVGWAWGSDALQPPDLEPLLDCGPRSAAPSVFTARLSQENAAAYEKYQSCVQHNEDIAQRNDSRRRLHFEGVVHDSREACRLALRRRFSDPAKVEFDALYGFNARHGLNGSGIEVTPLGLQVKMSGRSNDGAFQFVCQLDRAYRVVQVLQP
jgi:hypothetical protein